MRELRAASDRAALITIIVGMIAVMVAFLSALAAGLSAQSISALDEVYGKNDAVVISERAMPLSSSSMGETVRKSVQTWTNDHNTTIRDVYVNCARVDETPVTVISDFSLNDDQVATTGGVSETAIAEGDSLTLSGVMGEYEATVVRVVGDKWLDHQAVTHAGCGVMGNLTSGQIVPAAIVVDESVAQLPDVTEGTTIRGGECDNLLASYQDEQVSLNTATSMLYVISALVAGAFFTVWTVQRLCGVAISSALGTSRSVLVIGSLVQVLTVLAIGVSGGVVVTAAAGWVLQNGDVMPIVIDASTAVVLGLILTVIGVVGAPLALVLTFRVDPATALANAQWLVSTAWRGFPQNTRTALVMHNLYNQ